MNRLLIQNIEGRILLGVTMFVAIMILIGWVAINEPARMAAFEDQQLGRSIERGAELFAANCSTCHNPDGRGQAGRAPGLNNPQLFGYNYVGVVNDQILRLQRQIADQQVLLDELQAERESLFSEVGEGPTEERQAEIVARIQEIDAESDPEAEGSLASQTVPLEAELEPLLAERQQILSALGPALLRNYLPRLEEARAEAEETNDPIILTSYINDAADRLVQASWGGDLRGYLTTTLIHGRPGSQYIWGEGQQMVAWSQIAGGPLREDEIDNIVNFILNWDKGDDWTLEDLYAVNQFARIPADAALVTSGEGPTGAGEDVEEILSAISELEGDAAHGEQLYTGQVAAGAQPVVLGCSSCHLGGAQAPATTEQWDLAQNVRLQEPQLAGYTIEQYFVESIVLPNEYVVEGYAAGVMPNTYGDQLTDQDIADILAYIQSYDTE